jgi:hypothetical protein
MADSKQWQRLTAKRKFRIFLETRRPDAPVGEILRKYGLTLEDLRALEEAVESSAIAGLKVRAGHRKPMGPPSAEEYEQLCRELREKERAAVKAQCLAERRAHNIQTLAAIRAEAATSVA